MAGPRWTEAELDALSLSWDEFHRIFPQRSFDAWRLKRGRVEPASPVTFPERVDPDFHWRDATRVLRSMQDLAQSASRSSTTARIEIPTQEPIGLLFLSDTHLGDWATDYELFERITDEILQIPNLYIGLLGDLGHMAIKLRGVAEVSSNLLPPELQVAMVESWLDDMGERICFATWDNHTVEREELGSGVSMFRSIQERRVPYFNGIGHPDVVVGQELYALAVSHRFRGRSSINPCAGPMKYLIHEAYDREIAAQGDLHVPGLLQFTHGGRSKIALNAGTIQSASPYSQRHFSLVSHPIFPVLELHPDRHLAVPYWNLESWLTHQRAGSGSTRTR